MDYIIAVNYVTKQGSGAHMHLGHPSGKNPNWHDWLHTFSHGLGAAVVGGAASIEEWGKIIIKMVRVKKEIILLSNFAYSV